MMTDKLTTGEELKHNMCLYAAEHTRSSAGTQKKKTFKCVWT